MNLNIDLYYNQGTEEKQTWKETPHKSIKKILWQAVCYLFFYIKAIKFNITKKWNKECSQTTTNQL